MTEPRMKFWVLASVWGLAKALALMGLSIWGHALDERIPSLAYGPCLLLVVAHWVLIQDAIDYLLPALVRWVVPEEDWEEDLP